MEERPLPGNLGDIAGIEVPEYDCLREIDVNLRWPDGETGTASKWCDLISLKGADPVLCYDSEYYAGTPAVTKNRYGKGLVYYVGTELDPDTWQKLMGLILHESNLPDEFSSLPEGVEIARRTAEKMEYGFVMNHSNEMKPFSMPAGWRCILGNSEQLEPFGVSVFERENDRAE